MSHRETRIVESRVLGLVYLGLILLGSLYVTAFLWGLR
jgi:hypothetical protein